MGTRPPEEVSEDLPDINASSDMISNDVFCYCLIYHIDNKSSYTVLLFVIAIISMRRVASRAIVSRGGSIELR